jgi:hypothetical protein
VQDVSKYFGSFSPQPGQAGEPYAGHPEVMQRWHMLSVGVASAGLPWHVHGQTWLALTAGRKRWFTAALGQLSNAARGDPMGSSAAWLLETYPTLPLAEHPLECTQEAGEVVYLPPAWPHLTVNLGETIGVGAQVKMDPAPRHAEYGKASPAWRGSACLACRERSWKRVGQGRRGGERRAVHASVFTADRRRRNGSHRTNPPVECQYSARAPPARPQAL